MLETKYILEMAEPGRALVSISHNYIGFNINGHMEFDTEEEAKQFQEKWKHHFYDWSGIKITPVTRKKQTGG